MLNHLMTRSKLQLFPWEMGKAVYYMSTLRKKVGVRGFQETVYMCAHTRIFLNLELWGTWVKYCSSPTAVLSLPY